MQFHLAREEAVKDEVHILKNFYCTEQINVIPLI